MRMIGQASDFWRLRVSRIESVSPPELEWRDDLMYREPPLTAPRDEDAWVLEAVSLLGQSRVVRLGVYLTHDACERQRDAVADDLALMTKSQFEEAYIEDAPSSGPQDRGDHFTR